MFNKLDDYWMTQTNTLCDKMWNASASNIYFNFVFNRLPKGFFQNQIRSQIYTQIFDKMESKLK